MVIKSEVLPSTFHKKGEGLRFRNMDRKKDRQKEGLTERDLS